MIIVEGADNTGKSTVVRELIERLSGLFPLTRERFKVGMEGTIGRTHIDALLPLPTQNIFQAYNRISDRTFFSECIYGKLFRSGCRMTSAEHFQLYALLHRYHAIVLWCDPPDEVIKETWSKREQLYDRDPIVIANAYREMMPRLAYELPLFRYDYTTEGAPLALNRLVRYHQSLLDNSPLIHTCR